VSGRRYDNKKVEAPRYRLKLAVSGVMVAGIAFLLLTFLGVTSAPAVTRRAAPRPAASVVPDLPSVAQRVGAALRTDAPVVLSAPDGGSLALYPAPGATTPSGTLPAQDELGSPSVLLAVQRSGDWFRALLPTRPNGSTAWVRAQDVTVAVPTYEVEVSLSSRQLQLVRLSDGAVMLTSPVGIGAPATPTPTGEYFIRDLFPPSDPATSPYGPFAFGLSGHSDVLMHSGTGDGRIAIHGTNEPASIGSDISNGCVHVPNAVDLELTHYLTLGTPVFIS
jgi:lipoprotein-anchoring transpeptidase ErfK/SrfK